MRGASSSGLSLGATTSALGCARHLAPELARRDAAALRAKIERIEPLERRSAWLAVVDGTYDEAALAALRQRLSLPIGRLESALAKGPWLAGPDYSIADIDAYALVDPLRDLAPEVVNDDADTASHGLARPHRGAPRGTRRARPVAQRPPGAGVRARAWRPPAGADSR